MYKKVFTLFCLIVMFLLIPRQLYANGAPSQISSSQTGEIHPVHNSHIEITNEVIRFTNLKNYPSKLNLSMDVIIQYQMINVTDEDVSVDIMFPYDNQGGYGSNISISFDGDPVNYEIHEENDYFKKFNIERRKPEFGWREPSLILFNLEFEANTTSVLEVNYLQKSGYNDDDYSFLYYLQPAKYWNKYGNLHIYIEVPSNYELYSDFALHIDEENFFSKTYYLFDDKLPQKDIYFILRKTNMNPLFIVMVPIFIRLTVAIAIIIFYKRRKQS